MIRTALAYLILAGVPVLSAPATQHVATLTGTGAKAAAVVEAGVLVDVGGTTSFYGPSSPTPLWSVAPTISFQTLLDAGGSTLASLRFEHETPSSPRVPTMRKYTPASGTASMTFRFPLTVNNAASGLHVSHDGQTLVAWVFTFQMKECINSPIVNGAKQKLMSTDIAIFRGSASAPSSYVSLYLAGQPKASALSEDGRTLLMVSAIKRTVLDTQAATLRDDQWNTVDVGRDCAVSADGSAYAIARTRRYVDRWHLGLQQAPLDVGVDSVSCAALDYAGGSLVAGWSSGRVDVGSSSFTATAPVIDLDASQDGLTIATVTGGPTVYERSGSAWLKTFEQNVPGTLDVDLSGSMMATVGPGRIDLFRRGAVVPPMPSIEYRVAIPAAQATPGSTHSAPGYNVETGQPSGQAITVKVE